LKAEPTESQYELFGKYDSFDFADYFELAEFCKSQKIEFMTTCFDINSVRILKEIISRFKIASADVTNFQLIREIALTKKPILLSTGAASFEEVSNAVDFIMSVNENCDLTLLHCVLNYPTEIGNAQIERVAALKKRFPTHKIGYSDHTKPVDSLVAILGAYCFGARFFEKHFTLNKEMPGNDHYHSFDPNDLEISIHSLRKLEQSTLFDEKRFLSIQELARRNARRGLYLARDKMSGEILSAEDLIPLRPTVENGVSADLFFDSIGKRLVKNKSANAPLMLGDIG
jgi:N-acetylneuraminate synthase